jgi:tRNA nucleotidyltransferase (CCA-adding enzyme)
LLTAKLPPKDLSVLKRLFPQPGFVKHWEKLEHSAKEFQKELLDRKNARPSATWKLLTSYAPEAVLWLAYTSKNAQVQTKFKNFATAWPEARQKIPTAMMLEMRITPDLPGYENLVQEIFFQLMDNKLTTDEEMRAFLEPHSPPAPPPPVSIRRTRAKKAARIVEEDHDETLDEAGEEEDVDEQDDAFIKLAPAKKASSPKPVKSEAASAKGATAEATGKRGKAGVAAKTVAPVKAPVPAKTVAPEKPNAKKPGAKAAAAKPIAAVKPRAAKAVPAKKAAKSLRPAKKAQKPAAKVHKKAAVKPVKKPAAKPVKKPVAKKAAKPTKKKR